MYSFLYIGVYKTFYTPQVNQLNNSLIIIEVTKVKQEGKIVFDKKIFDIGQSKAVTLPPEVLNSLNLKKGTKVKLMVDKGKFGVFLAIWNPKQQKKNKEE